MVLKRLSASLQNLFNFRSRCLGKHIQHKPFRIADRMVRLNSNSQPRKLIRAQTADNRFQTVVTTGRTTFPNANLSKRQSQIVGYDDQLLARRLRACAWQSNNETDSPLKFMKVCGLTSLTAQPAISAATYQRLTLALVHRNPGVTRQLVNQHEPEVMTRPLIFGARVSQTNDETHTLPIANCQLPIGH